MKEARNIRTRLVLAVFAGLMLGFAFPPVPTGAAAFLAFVPLFLLLESIEEYGRALRYSYLSFLVFNIVTLYWTGGFTHGRDLYLMFAGALLVLAHPLFFCLPVMCLIFFRRQYGFKASLLAFPAIWVTFEYLHSVTEIGFPWLTIGNTQTYDLYAIQFASLTGVLGVSFWIACINVLSFFLIAKIAVGEWNHFSSRSLFTLILILSVYMLPRIYGWSVLKNHPVNSENKIRIAAVQPNIDPFDKWTDSGLKQLAIIQSQTLNIGADKADLVIWPETAVPFYALHPFNRYSLDRIREMVDTLGTSLLAGIPDIKYYREGEIIPKSSKISAEGKRYDTYNSSMLIEARSSEIQKYAKVLLVPFAERVPFSEALSFLNAMQWNFGLGGWAHGRDTSVLKLKTARGLSVPFSNMICYESAYPGYVASFVNKGAQFLTVITNDSWWGNTPGAYQHKQFAVLRAVENHRWIVQCANGGISCFIDPFGRTTEETGMFVQTTLSGNISARSDLTFYSEHGDWFGDACLIICAFILASAAGNKFYRYVRKRNDYTVANDSAT